MTWIITALLIAIISLFVMLWFAWEEVHRLNGQVYRLTRQNLMYKKATDKETEFAAKLIETNQAQARQIRELKNRISF